MPAPLNIAINHNDRTVVIRPTKKPTEWTAKEAEAADETIRVLRADYQKLRYKLCFKEYEQRDDATKTVSDKE